MQTNGRLPFAPLSQKLARAPSEPDWFWRGYVARGVLTAWAGRPKVGKTTLLAALLQALPEGREFLGLETRATRVLLLSEEREGTLQEKRHHHRLSDDVELLMLHEALDAPWSRIVEQATHHCVEREIGVVVVDTFNAWAGLRGDDESKAGAVLEAVKPLQAMAAAGLGVVLAVHQRKSEGAYGEALRGSNALAGAVDVFVELERAPGAATNARVLRTVSRLAASPAELVAELSEHAYTACGDLAEAGGRAQDARIQEALAQHPAGATAEVLAETTGIGEATVRRRLNTQYSDGRVRRLGAGTRGDAYIWIPAASDCTGPLSLNGANNGHGAQ